jgi:hypothetical protein
MTKDCDMIQKRVEELLKRFAQQKTTLLANQEKHIALFREDMLSEVKAEVTSRKRGGDEEDGPEARDHPRRGLSKRSPINRSMHPRDGPRHNHDAGPASRIAAQSLWLFRVFFMPMTRRPRNCFHAPRLRFALA